MVGRLSRPANCDLSTGPKPVSALLDIGGVRSLARLAVIDDVDADRDCFATTSFDGPRDSALELPGIDRLVAIAALQERDTSAGRGRLPTWVVTMRSVLVCGM